MKSPSASESLWPAAKMTWRFLFSPFDWLTFLKLAGVAVMSETVWVCFRFTAGPLPEFGISLPSVETLLAPQWITFTLLAAAVALFLVFFAYYVAILLRFVLFHCLLHGDRSLRAAWSLHQRAAWRLFKASLGMWLALAGMALLVLAAIGIGAFTLLHLKSPEGKLDAGIFLLMLFPTLGFAALVALTGVALQLVLHDLILPRMALADETFRTAWRAAWRAIRMERETFASYFILRVGLPVILGFVLGAVGWALEWAAFGLLGISAQGFEAMVDNAPFTGEWAGVGVQMLFAVMALGLGLLFAFALGGPLATGMRCYAMHFYGGRYPALGEKLAELERAQMQDAPPEP